MGDKYFLSSISFRPASILPEAKFLFACLWGLEIVGGGQCYLLLFEGFVVFDFNQGLTVLSWLTWNALYRPGVPRTLRSGCSFSQC